ncbi:hypothetical protein [Polyangium mundeleinium]|uniref:Uncharacterized protein n=1 Tax=Polyangium mundeleinium TaxID=2995306 RepID=A0ABT5EHC5_9BACT|nr:hypothetical protein [Polyangium mundeleinium]MDC0741218.1 hypothetical protein [Polyangium mundeleinium]
MTGVRRAGTPQSPFREPPKLELGPLSVGLHQAASRAMKRLPSGGRIVRQGPTRRIAHTQGALGCTGLVLAASAAFIAITTGWLPQSHAEVAIVMVTVIVAGACLAAVLLALDRARPLPTCEAEPVGHAARLVAQRLARLATCAAEDTARFGPRRINALRRALSAAADPALATWIPDDVRGRAELLLARAIVAHARPGWTRDAAVRAEVRGLLVRAATHLDEPAVAAADLVRLDAAPLPPADAVAGAHGREPLRKRFRQRFASEPGSAADEAAAEEEAQHEEMRPRARRRRERRANVIP